MRLPRDDSPYTARVRFGRYTARRLERARCNDLAEECARATRALREAGRSVEDTEDAVQDAMASRDATGDALTALVRVLRHTLAGRSLTAMKEAPYTRIFPEGTEYYTEASQGELVTRHRQLVHRLEQHLPEEDPVRVQYVPCVTGSIEEYAHTLTALEDARIAQQEASARLQEATVLWNQTLVRAYGTLIARLGKAEAERFFPRVHPSRPRRKGDEAQKPAGDAAKKPLRSVA
jgi:hypothetical protein